MTIPVPLTTRRSRPARSPSSARWTRWTIDWNSGISPFARIFESSRRTRSTIIGRGRSQLPSASRTLFTPGIARRERDFTSLRISTDDDGVAERFVQLQQRMACAPFPKFSGLSRAWLQQRKAIIRRWSEHQLKEFCVFHPYFPNLRRQSLHKG